MLLCLPYARDHFSNWNMKRAAFAALFVARMAGS